MPRFWGSKHNDASKHNNPSKRTDASKRNDATGLPPSEETSTSSWVPPSLAGTPVSQENPSANVISMLLKCDPLIPARWYVTCNDEIPKYLVSLCNALHVNCSIIKNQHHERFLIKFSEDVDRLFDSTEISLPPPYSKGPTEPDKKRMMFDQLGINPSVDYLIVAKDLCQVHIRNDLVVLINTLFSFSFMKSVVQTRMEEDKLLNHNIENFGVEVSLRTVEFQGIKNIEMKLKELSRKGMSRFMLVKLGVTWIKYGSWESDPNAKEAIWVIFGVWPKSLKCIYI
jgi:hypothetical protein